MDPRGGNRRSRAPSRSTGFAPTGMKKHAGRPAGRSVSRTRKAENARFWAGSRQGDGATRRSLMSVRGGLKLVAVADAAPGNRTFLEKLWPDERAVDFFSCTARFPTVASNWKYRAVLRDDVDGKVALSPRQGDDGTGAQGSQAHSDFFRNHGRRLCEPQGQRLRLRRRPPTRSWSTSA